MDWGKWITVSFILFAAFIATIVTICVNQDISLVSKNYYADEIGFQEQIERKRNTASLAEKPEISISQNKLLIKFPAKSSVESGFVQLFRPSSAQFDQNFRLTGSDEVLRVFELKSIERGAYRVKLNWTMAGKEYYLEKSISI